MKNRPLILDLKDVSNKNTETIASNQVIIEQNIKTSHIHDNKDLLNTVTAAYTTAEKDKLATVAINANNYVHPTTAGNIHIPSGGASAQILRWSASGVAVWGAENNTTYAAATTTVAGLMSAADKVKVDGLTVQSINYTLGTGVTKDTTAANVIRYNPTTKECTLFFSVNKGKTTSDILTVPTGYRPTTTVASVAASATRLAFFRFVVLTSGICRLDDYENTDAHGQISWYI